jgi:hypothetical protein
VSFVIFVREDLALCGRFVFCFFVFGRWLAVRGKTKTNKKKKNERTAPLRWRPRRSAVPNVDMCIFESGVGKIERRYRSTRRVHFAQFIEKLLQVEETIPANEGSIAALSDFPLSLFFFSV